ncbi:MAG TPA: glucose-6-phosphate isomerase [Bacteroidales bacterium]|nr:glucose-6-phosphate isomerase [Bacteroidales bacterium]
MELKIDYSNCLSFLKEEDILSCAAASAFHLEAVLNRTAAGSEFLGWVTLPHVIEDQVGRIKEAAAKLRTQAEITVVIGIGGSYLGAKAIIHALENEFEYTGRYDRHRVLFAGQNISEDYLSNLSSFLKGKRFNLIVISKSGTTTEPAIAFRILRKQMEEQIGKDSAAKHIIAVTDAKRGALRMLSDREGYDSFIIPDDVGGRFSVFTPVGLLPVACAGININDLIDGAKSITGRTHNITHPATNPALIYSAVRNLLYRKGMSVEMIVNFEPSLHFVSEWWKQLFGESEGKQGKGIFPSSADMTTDLHSLGQYIQDGSRILFETIISIEKSHNDLRVPFDGNDFDKLNYIAGKRISEVNHKAEEGTLMAHTEGGVPNIRIILPQVSEQSLGRLLYFFEISCAVSGYELGVNPFDQPGVETYKKNMFTLLGKPGI